MVTHAGFTISVSPVWNTVLLLCAGMSAAEIGPFKFILAHMGGWRNWDEVPELLSDTGAYIDTAFSTEEFPPLDDGYWDDKNTSMLDAAETVKIIRAFGSDHVLFGTDSPWSDQRQSLIFHKAPPCHRMSLTISFSNNAERFLSLRSRSLFLFDHASSPAFAVPPSSTAAKYALSRHHTASHRPIFRSHSPP